MYTLSGFRRRLQAGQSGREVAMEPGHAYWLPAQTHAGENTGTTPTHVLFVELKDGETVRPDDRASDSGSAGSAPSVIGPG